MSICRAVRAQAGETEGGEAASSRLQLCARLLARGARGTGRAQGCGRRVRTQRWREWGL